MSRARYLLSAALVVLLCVWGGTSAWGGAHAASKKPIVIGGAIALTGGFSAYDLENRVGAQLAVNDINAAGGLLGGRPLKYVVADTQSSLTVGPVVANTLISKGAVAMITMCDFDFGAPAALVAQSHKVPSFSCASSAKFGLSGIGPYAFDVSVPVNEEGAAIAQTAYQSAHARNAYVLTDTSLSYSTEDCAAFTKAFAAYPGAKIVGSDKFQNSDTSVATQITRLNSVSPKPDVIALCSYLPGGPSVVRQLRAAGITIPIVTGSGMESRGAYASIPNLSNLYIVTYASIYGQDPRPQVKKFFQRFKAAFGSPAAVPYPLFAYSQVQIIADAIKKTNSTSGPALVKALQTFNKVQTLAGPVTYTSKQHYFYYPVAIVKYVNGSEVFQRLLTKPLHVPPPQL